ncbi:hypothetical protein [uncultured Clostridium sp.]|nr:hypothetical protein [uncultured Clostridium sp.]
MGKDEELTNKILTIAEKYRQADISTKIKIGKIMTIKMNGLKNGKKEKDK